MLTYQRDRTLADAANKAWSGAWAQGLTEAQALSSDDDAEVAGSARRIIEGLRAYRAGMDSFLKQLSSGAVLSAGVGNELMEPARAGLRDAEAGLMPLVQRISERADLGRTSQDRRGRLEIAILVTVALLGTAVVIGIAVLTFRAISTPLTKALEAVHRVAHGDLTTETQPDQAPQELAVLLLALGHMQQGLSTLVVGVRDSAAVIDLSTAELVAGNFDLSQRTDRDVLALDESAHTVEQLRLAFEESAEAARRAQNLALAADGAAATAISATSELSEGMRVIQESAARIADIVRVIDGIAFQTNLLALNAAVEAARAGPQGRGFAVVAQEVRELAQRCADSAQQIRKLVTETRDRVRSGAEMADAAGASMADLQSEVTSVAQAIGNVAGSASRQGGHVQDLLNNVNHLHAATQQHAALVEQSAAAAASLRRQTSALSAMVGTFVVPQEQSQSEHATSKGRLQ